MICCSPQNIKKAHFVLHHAEISSLFTSCIAVHINLNRRNLGWHFGRRNVASTSLSRLACSASSTQIGILLHSSQRASSDWLWLHLRAPSPGARIASTQLIIKSSNAPNDRKKKKWEEREMMPMQWNDANSSKLLYTRPQVHSAQFVTRRVANTPSQVWRSILHIYTHAEDMLHLFTNCTRFPRLS